MKMSQYDLVPTEIQQNSVTSATMSLVTAESEQKCRRSLLKVNTVPSYCVLGGRVGGERKKIYLWYQAAAAVRMTPSFLYATSIGSYVPTFRDTLSVPEVMGATVCPET